MAVFFEQVENDFEFSLVLLEGRCCVFVGVVDTFIIVVNAPSLAGVAEHLAHSCASHLYACYYADKTTLCQFNPSWSRQLRQGMFVASPH